jgi:hypothetical protein
LVGVPNECVKKIKRRDHPSGVPASAATKYTPALGFAACHRTQRNRPRVYKNSSNALQVHVDEEDKTSYLIQVSGSTYKANTLVINESGLYSLILSSCTQRNRPRVYTR